MSRWRVPLLLLTGSLLLQVAWIIAVPPFRGIDEFDHAYRAAAVARGQWVAPPKQAQHGRGDLVAVPRSLVTAATPECEIYKYVGHDDCHPVTDLGNGMVSVASAASSYNPVFYWIIGTVARPFSGAAALYAMRLCAAAICSVLLALAAWQTGLWAATRWPIVGLAAALTPVTIYSTTMPAPNGLEMMAGLSVWSGLLGLVRPDLAASAERRLLLSCLPGLICLAIVRLLGPLWLGMIVLSFLALAGRRRLTPLWHRQKARLCMAISLALLASAASFAWSIVAGTTNPVDSGHLRPYPHGISHSLADLPLWILQTIASFPTRNEPAPTPVYAIGLLVFVAVLVAGTRAASTRQRVVLTAATIASVLVPLVGAVMTYPRMGDWWQGRYELPFALGIPLIASLAPNARRFDHRLVKPMLVGGWAAIVLAECMSVIGVLVMEREGSPLVGTSEWHIPPVWLVIALVVAGMGLLALAVKRAQGLSSTSLESDASLNQDDQPLPVLDPS